MVGSGGGEGGRWGSASTDGNAWGHVAVRQRAHHKAAEPLGMHSPRAKQGGREEETTLHNLNEVQCLAVRAISSAAPSPTFRDHTICSPRRANGPATRRGWPRGWWSC